MCKRAENASAAVHSCPGRDSTQRNELSKQKQKTPLKIDLQKFYKSISIRTFSSPPPPSPNKKG